MVWTVTSVALLLSAMALIAWMRWITSPRLDQFVSVATHWQFERPVRIRVSDRYFLYIYFSRKDASFEVLRAIVGGAYGQTMEVDGKRIDAGEPAGVPIPLRWSLRHAETGSVVASAQSVKLGSNSWSADEVGRLLHQCDIAAGRYIFRGELLRGVPEFRNIHARLVLELLPKQAHSRVMGVYWLGSLLVPFTIIGAALAALAAIVLWK